MSSIPQGAAAADLVWRKSSFSGAQSNCVEVAEAVSAAVWRKSSYSAQANDCVETGRLAPLGMAVRDSKDPGGPVLLFEGEAWADFLSGVKSGELSVG
ncbi:DUF397 domain-containing protein [Kitasatospora sp. NPDC094011]|uniref:DUF397 domain-containing protein n=1 Tax=Kitasatospora sp. NPDC094011 TaxID=3364090 RepID=UPI00382417B2